jgi:hypothetical protein
VEATVALADDLEVGAYGRVITLGQEAPLPSGSKVLRSIFARAACIAPTPVTFLNPMLRHTGHRTMNGQEFIVVMSHRL